MIEMATTLAVAAVVLALAIPSFTAVINSNRLTGESNQLIAALQAARSEALRLNVRTTVCRTTNGGTCSGVSGYGAPWPAWFTWADLNRDSVKNSNEIFQNGTFQAPLQVLISPAIDTGKIVFHPDGLARADNGTLLRANIAVCIPTLQPATNVRHIGIIAGSRFGVEKIDGGGACPTPPNP